jgi:biopolymer transport protein ExbD
MRTKLFFVLLMVFALSAPTTFAAKAKKLPNADKIENKLSEEEVARMTKRIEEIRDMDKSNLTVTEKRELRKELKTTKENLRKDGGYIYISVATVALIVLLVLLLA